MRITGSKTRQLRGNGACTPGFIEAAVAGATFQAVLTEPSGVRYSDSGRSDVPPIFRETRKLT